MNRLTGLTLVGVVAQAQPVYPQSKQQVKVEIESQVITPATESWMKSKLVSMKRGKGDVWIPSYEPDDSDWVEILSRLGWVFWENKPLPEDARLRTNACANTTRRSRLHIPLVVDEDVGPFKRSFCFGISRINDRILAEDTIIQLREKLNAVAKRLETVETKLGIQKQ